MGIFMRMGEAVAPMLYALFGKGDARVAREIQTVFGKMPMILAGQSTKVQIPDNHGLRLLFAVHHSRANDLNFNIYEQEGLIWLDYNMVPPSKKAEANIGQFSGKIPIHKGDKVLIGRDQDPWLVVPIQYQGVRSDDLRFEVLSLTPLIVEVAAGSSSSGVLFGPSSQLIMRERETASNLSETISGTQAKTLILGHGDFVSLLVCGVQAVIFQNQGNLYIKAPGQKPIFLDTKTSYVLAGLGVEGGMTIHNSNPGQPANLVATIINNNGDNVTLDLSSPSQRTASAEIIATTARILPNAAATMGLGMQAVKITKS